MPRASSPAASKPVADDEIEGEATVVDNGQEFIADLARERAERGLTVHSAVPQRQLILSNNDRMTVHGMIVAQLGTQGLTVTPAEFEYFVRVCELRGVNPLFREAHLIKDRDGRITVQIGIDGFRKLSEDTGEYRGTTATEWGEELYEGPVTAWRGKPNYCRVGVLRAGFDAPVYGEAWLDEDGQVGRDGQPIGQWLKRPRTMLEKVAEVRARRKAFPRQLAGVYSDEEIPGPESEPRLVGAGEGVTTAPQPTGAPETAAATTEGTWRPPEPPPAPEGVQGVIEAAPDGIRRARPTSEISKKYGLHDQMVDKLEIVLKAKGRKHTAVVFGPLALAADAAQLQVGEPVVVTGTVEEIVWQEGKPTKKEIWGVTSVSVLRDNEWVAVATNAPTLPLDETPPSAPPTSTPVVATDAPPVAPTPTPETAAVEPALGAPPADLTPPAAPAPRARQPLAPAPAIASKVDDEQAGPFILRLVGDISFGNASGRRYGAFSAAHGSGETLRCVVGDEPAGELEATLGAPGAPTFHDGDDVRVVGFWKNEWLVVSAIGIEPL